MHPIKSTHVLLSIASIMILPAQGMSLCQVLLLGEGWELAVDGIGFADPPTAADQSTLALSDFRGNHCWALRIEADASLKFKQPYVTMRRKPDPDVPRDILPVFKPSCRGDGMTSVTFAGPGLEFMYITCFDKIYRMRTKTHGVLYQKSYPPRRKK